jgi:site-specific DNA-cytosine methylase
MYWALSLCSGLGGQCEAFVQHPLWAVVRIENNEKLADVPHTRLLDVNHWIDWLPGLIKEMGGPPSIVIAAPPCTEFSNAFNAPKSKARRAGLIDDYKPNLDCVISCQEIIDFCEPDFWILENVVGAIEFLTGILGPFKQTLGPFVFWGVFPYLDLPRSQFSKHKSRQTWSSADPLRANKRAMWPIEISQALLENVMGQSRLSDWC